MECLQGLHRRMFRVLKRSGLSGVWRMALYLNRGQFVTPDLTVLVGIFVHSRAELDDVKEMGSQPDGLGAVLASGDHLEWVREGMVSRDEVAVQ